MFTAALFIIAKIWKSINEQVNIYIMEYYSVIKWNEILPFLTIWIGLKGIMLSKLSQSEKDKYYLISFVCGIWTDGCQRGVGLEDWVKYMKI